MKSSTIIGIVVAILIIGAGGYWLLNQAPDTEVPQNGDPNGNGQEFEQTISDGAIIIGYGGEYGLAVNQQQILTDSVIPPCDEGFDYCVYYVGDEYEGTTFGSAGLSVTRRADIAAEAACLSTQPAGYTNLNPQIERTDTYAVAAFGPLQNAAAGHFSTGELYRLAFDEQCYEFETRIGQAQIANFPVGTIRAFSENDEREVRAELREVLDGIRLLSGGNVEFPVL